jgi:hypothetical protein
MASGLEQALFSPMGREMCAYFFWLTVIAFVFLLLAAVEVVMSFVNRKGGFSLGKLMKSILTLAFPFLIYFNNRLLYSMCVN